jgi:hypothetical protein
VKFFFENAPAEAHPLVAGNFCVMRSRICSLPYS